MKKISIFFATVALIAGIVGCGVQIEYTPMVAAGIIHTVGLASNGTVVAVGDNEYGQCDVGNWTGITQVAAGYAHTWDLNTAAPWSPWETTSTGSAMSPTG
jgi:alpha-tubulin suppressor-like RCC1 family protein